MKQGSVGRDSWEDYESGRTDVDGKRQRNGWWNEHNGRFWIVIVKGKGKYGDKSNLQAKAGVTMEVLGALLQVDKVSAFASSDPRRRL